MADNDRVNSLFRWGLLAAALGSGAGAQADFRLRASPDMQAPLSVRLSAQPPAGQTVVWNFGDGTQFTGNEVTHVFYRPGNYTIVATTFAGDRRIGEARANLQVKSAGDEKARLTLLLAPGALRLSDMGSVIYAPRQTRYFLDGKEIPISKTGLPVKSESVRVSNRRHTVSVVATAGGKTYRQDLNFMMAPVQTNPAFDAEVLRLTNGARAAGFNCKTLKTGGPKLPPLTRDPTLDSAAAAQSVGMALGGYFDHQSGLDGSSPARRLEATGLQVTESGENIASGQNTPAEVVQGWLRSYGHCENIMNDFTHIGLSYIFRPDSVQKTYWTQVFARP